MKKLRTIILYTGLVIATICIVPKANAQGPGFGGDTLDAPIDGGISLLIAAGVMYGVKKIKSAREKDADK